MIRPFDCVLSFVKCLICKFAPSLSVQSDGDLCMLKHLGVNDSSWTSNDWTGYWLSFSHRYGPTPTPIRVQMKNGVNGGDSQATGCPVFHFVVTCAREYWQHPQWLLIDHTLSNGSSDCSSSKSRVSSNGNVTSPRLVVLFLYRILPVL